MNYLYIIVFFLSGIYLVFTAIKEYRFLLLPGIYFIFLGAWWLIDIPVQADLLNGVYGWIIRAISAIILLATGAIYYFKYYKQNKQ